jgi:hypothetical protein
VSNRADLQELADICNDWFEAQDIHLNPKKSVHLSFDPTTKQPTEGGPIQLRLGGRDTPALKLQPLKEPLRVLGMYTVPDGSHAPMYQLCSKLAESQARMLRARAMTDKIALFVVRAVLMPALAYKMQGHAFNSNEIHKIFQPIKHALKHICHLPISFPSSFMHHRLAGKVPRLETVHTANNLTILVRAVNAPSPLSEITLARIAATEHRLCFPGPMLEIPWHILQAHLTPPRNGAQRLTISALTRALHERGVALSTPRSISRCGGTSTFSPIHLSGFSGSSVVR